MKGPKRFLRTAPGLLLAMMAFGWGCAAGVSYGPVPVQGVVTEKHQIPPSSNRSEGPGQEKPRYFLWVKTKDGPVYVEVTEGVFRTVAEGDQVCINCDSGSP
jgi:hypothetical protein